jgi:hypothetical protein
MYYLNEYSNLVIAMATCLTSLVTWQIMKVNSNQTKIAEQKRKDDLFKIRWECYQEILNKLQTNYSLYNTNFFEQIDNMQKVGHEMPTGQYLENIFTSHHYFISQVRWLFNDEIADIVQKLLISKSTLSSRKKSKKKEYYSHYLDVIEYEHYNQNIQKFEKAKMVNPTLEFTKKFDNYLKLK